MEQELALAEWAEDQAPALEQDVLDGQYLEYAKEGHLCAPQYLDAFDPAGRWVAWCLNCKTSAFVSSWTEAKLWTRNHRAEYGLARQEFGPVFGPDVSG